MPTIVKKKIFISDIHMGDSRSFNNLPYPYGWLLGKNIDKLADFLNKQLEFDKSVEVVILGDLFDTWVIPVDLAPLPDFQAIVKCDANQRVISALKKLAEKHMLTYIPGNHDMPISKDNHADVRKFLKTTFEGINYDPLDDGTYEDGTVLGVHGNQYALFNAPDADWYLPIGYFISRMAASKVAQKGTKEDYHEIFNGFVDSYMDNPDFIHNLFMGMARDSDLDNTSTINMQGIAGFDTSPNVEEIGRKYQDLAKNWQKNLPQNIHSNLVDAVAGDVGDLALAASHIYLRPPGSEHKIIVLGHNHIDEMWTNVAGTNRLLPTTPSVRKKRPKRLIYVNCGTWIDSKRHCTYVETEKNEAEKRHYARSLEYPGPKLLKERFVEI